VGCRIAADAHPKAGPIGENVKSAERYRRNFSVRAAVRQQGKIARNHLLTGTPDALRLASVRLASMQHWKYEGKNAGTDKHAPRCRNRIGDGGPSGVRAEGSRSSLPTSCLQRVRFSRRNAEIVTVTQTMIKVAPAVEVMLSGNKRVPGSVISVGPGLAASAEAASAGREWRSRNEGSGR